MNESTVLDWENNACPPAIRLFPRMFAFLGYDPSPDPQSLAERLVMKRRHVGLSRRRMAKVLTADEGTLAAWETGKRRPSGRRLQIVEQLLTSYR